MKFVSKKTIILFIAILALQTYAQIGGISGSKLNAVNTDVVNHHVVEFEPAFTFFSSNSFWDHRGDIIHLFHSSDSVKNSSNLNFRFTYGLWNKLEVGVSITGNVESSSWGLKYVFNENDKLSFAFITGINIHHGNKTIDKSVDNPDNLKQAGLGLVSSYQANKDLSFDLNIQYMRYMNTVNIDNNKNIFLDFNGGYYLFEKQLQIILGAGFHYIEFDRAISNLFTLYPGITVETGKNYIIVLNFPFDVSGKNNVKGSGFNLALTLSID